MEIQERISNFAQTAVKYAQSFNEDLDYSKESLAAVEKILDYYSQDLQSCNVEEKPSEDQVWSMATIWGAYIGEVMRRELGPGFIWTDDEETFGNKTPHIRNTRAEVETFPIDKAYKRLVNGTEDNVVTYFDVGIEYLTGKCHWTSGHTFHIKRNDRNE